METEESDSSSESSSKQNDDYRHSRIMYESRASHPATYSAIVSGIRRSRYRLARVQPRYNTGNPPRGIMVRCLRFFRKEAAITYAIAGAKAPSNLNTFARIIVRNFYPPSPRAMEGQASWPNFSVCVSPKCK